MSDRLPALLPNPRRVELHDGVCAQHAPLREDINRSILRPQGYRIDVTPAAIVLTAHDSAGLHYGRCTLAQIRAMAGPIPCLTIEDWPDFPARGVMLDISRDKVPTLDTLFQLIERLGSWKINQLQLYMEHTFAYAGHEEVWENASPLTAEELQRLDAFCRERWIDLVPNQNSFGHMERWLKHEKYVHLAEAPDGAPTPWGYTWKGPFSLCPTDPASIELLEGLYRQLLPHFTSRLFNVGCDETFDIGQGRSREGAAAIGKSRIYLEFLQKVHSLVTQHGRRMMFWGDIILNSPELIPELPGGAIALNWGYEADHPFDIEAAKFAEAGVQFYVCPGTSSWLSLAGRTENMIANQIAAANAGLAHGAMGFLNTDWGDHGHLQYLPASYAGFALGAAVSWCAAANEAIDLEAVVRQYAFASEDAGLARIWLDLGNVYQSIEKLTPNASALFRILVPAPNKDPMNDITLEALDAAHQAIRSAIKGLANMNESLEVGETRNAARMLIHACKRGRWLLAGRQKQDALELSIDMKHIIREHRRLWLARNRPGGLVDSVARLQANLDSYSS